MSFLKVLKTLQKKPAYGLQIYLILLICVMTLFSLTQFSSQTSAYFESKAANNHMINIGTWWDKSDLLFHQQPTFNESSCPNPTIAFTFKNQGFSMIGPSSYEIYFSEQEGKKGSKIFEDDILALGENQTLPLTFETEETGYYSIKLLQRQGYQGNEDTRTELWSDVIFIECVEELEEEQPPSEVEEDEVEDNDPPVKKDKKDKKQDNKPEEQENNKEPEVKEEETTNEAPKENIEAEIEKENEKVQETEDKKKTKEKSEEQVKAVEEEDIDGADSEAKVGDDGEKEEVAQGEEGSE
ncbi:amyloid fiber anchoring/assembly protein TapA [Saliterribacillus persicus]|uniref:YqxM protein n=1 Tax=Saliterribacillus persicus TaxID=930114 RepID=A0A368Y3F4_9BACI|nr:amyloid fiber anchoring/assembly protein TapA [Saliterribacillus persicus]RCW74712.1 YqxM protein [Saliterribacillus persicus]